MSMSVSLSVSVSVWVWAGKSGRSWVSERVTGVPAYTEAADIKTLQGFQK